MGAACVAHLGHTAQYLYPNNWAPARSLGSLITVYGHELHPGLQAPLCSRRRHWPRVLHQQEIAADRLTPAEPRWHWPGAQEKKVHQDPCFPIGQHLTHRWCVASHDAASGCHGFEQTPAEHKRHREIQMHITARKNLLIALGLQ